MRPWCRMTQTTTAPTPRSWPRRCAPDVLERLLRYVRIDTQSDRAHAQSPSTPGQLELGRLLVEELLAIGLADAAQDANGFVTATLAGNVRRRARDRPARAPRHEPRRVRHGRRAARAPRLRRRGDRAAARAARVLDPERMPELSAKVGHDLVTTSGDTLLGADDKAGMAEVMARGRVSRRASRAAAPDDPGRLHARRGDRQGRARCSTSRHFGATCAYTLDGSEAGEFTDETFTAASVDADDPRRRRASRLRHRQARQRGAARRAACWRRCRRTG